MKWADANTRLSFATAILNCLRAAISPSTAAPAAFQQHDADRRAREIRRRAGIPPVTLVAQLAVEHRDRVAPCRGADPSGREHLLRAAPHGGGFGGAELAGDVRVGG